MLTSHSTAEGEAWNAAFNDNNETNTSSTACSFWGSEAININKEKMDTNNSSNKTAGGDKNEDSSFECIICLDTAKNPVVTTCGHLFCWPCLYKCMQTKLLCPVCKSAISEYNVIPIYIHNSTNHEYPSNEVPPRPDGQRTQPVPQQAFRGFSFCAFQIPFGIETFCFMILICIIFIIIIYAIAKYRKSHSRPKYKDVLYSNKNHEIYTQPQK